MTKKRRNYDQNHFKVGGSPQPADEIVPDREKEKVTRADAEVAEAGDETERLPAPDRRTEEIQRAMGRTRGDTGKSK